MGAANDAQFGQLRHVSGGRVQGDEAVPDKAAAGDLPDAGAPIIIVEIAAGDENVTDDRLFNPVIGEEIEFAIGAVAVQPLVHVADIMGGQRERRHDLVLLRDEGGGAVAEQRAMIVDGILMIDRSQQLAVAPVDCPAVTHGEVAQGVLGEQGVDRGVPIHRGQAGTASRSACCAASVPARRPNTTELPMLVPPPA